MSVLVRRPSLVLTAAAIAALLGLAGCGSSSEPAGEMTGTDTPATSTPEAAPSTTADPAPSGAATAAESEPASEPSSPGADDNDPALCDAADLSGSVATLPGGGAAGSVYRGLTVTNTSERNCVLQGFPGVSYVDAQGGAQIGAAADRDTSSDSVAIDLAPGVSAVATLKQTNAQNYGEQCEQAQAAGLRVYPPSAYDSLFVEQEIPACANEAVELMTIGAFQPEQ